MEIMADVLENEFRNAFEVRDEKSLHRGISILVESIPHKQENKTEHDQFREAMLKMDARTDSILLKMDEGFKRMDERFKYMDERFTHMDERFESIQKQMDNRFENMQKQMDERFSASDARFETMQKQMDERFSAVDKRFDDVNRRFDMQYRFTTIGFILIGVLISVYQFLA